MCHCWREYTYGPAEVGFTTALDLDADADPGIDAEADDAAPVVAVLSLGFVPGCRHSSVLCPWWQSEHTPEVH